jgi:hypothetical protein
MSSTKRCSACHNFKSLDEFYNDRTRPDGKGHECKACNKVRDAQRHHSKAMKSVDISREDYHSAYTQQGGRCAICGNPPKGKRLTVDHDHATGKFRGLLCARCNFGLGWFQDDPDRLRSAAEYLENLQTREEEAS